MALFYFMFEANFPSISPRGLIFGKWRFFCVAGLGGLYLEGLIHGGGYCRNFTVSLWGYSHVVHIGGLHMTSRWPCWWSRTNKTIPFRWELNLILWEVSGKKSLDWPATSPPCHVLVKLRIWFRSCKISDKDRGVSLKGVDTLVYMCLSQIW